MEIINKILERGKAFAAAAVKEFQAIQSPIVRVAVLIFVVIAALMMIWKALPVLIVLGLIAGIVFVVMSALADDEGKGRP